MGRGRPGRGPPSAPPLRPLQLAPARGASCALGELGGTPAPGPLPEQADRVGGAPWGRDESEGSPPLPGRAPPPRRERGEALEERGRASQREKAPSRLGGDGAKAQKIPPPPPARGFLGSVTRIESHRGWNRASACRSSLPVRNARWCLCSPTVQLSQRSSVGSTCSQVMLLPEKGLPGRKA